MVQYAPGICKYTVSLWGDTQYVKGGFKEYVNGLKIVLRECWMWTVHACMNVKVSLQLLMHCKAIFLVEKLCHVGRDRSTAGCNSHEGNLYCMQFMCKE